MRYVILDTCDPVRAARQFCQDRGMLWLDSADERHPAARWSYLCLQPVATLTVPGSDLSGEDDAFQRRAADIRTWIRGRQRTRIPGGPPFQGGVAGYVAYDAAPLFLDRFRSRHAPRSDLAEFSLYDTVLAFDLSGEGTLLMTGEEVPLSGLSGLAMHGDTLWATGPGGIAFLTSNGWTLRYTLADEPIRVVFSITEAADGGLWFGANGGALSYRGSQWAEFPASIGLPHQVVHAALQDTDGTLWFACRSGLARWDGESMDVFHPDVNFGSILQDSDGILWFGTRGRGALRLERGEWAWTGDGMDLFPMAESPDGTVWAVSESAGVMRLEGGSWLRVGPVPGGDDNPVYSMAVTRDSRVWAATATGVFHLQ